MDSGSSTAVILSSISIRPTQLSGRFPTLYSIPATAPAEIPSMPPSPRTRAALGPLSRVFISTGAFSEPGDFEPSKRVIAFIAMSSGASPRSIASSRTSRALSAGSTSANSSSIRTNRRASISP